MAEARTRLICPLTATSVAAMRADMVAAAAEGADMVECRLDYLDSLPDAEELADLLGDPPVPLIATCRPAWEGGEFRGEESHRLRLLADARRFAGVEAVDVELAADAGDAPTDKRIVSHHNFDECPADLDAVAERLHAAPAAVSKVAFATTGPDEALRAFDLLRAAPRAMMAIGMGEHGAVSRIAGGKFGAYGSFAALSASSGSAPGQLTLHDMRHIYRFETIGPATELYGVIGCPVAHSMSPAIHNAAFAATGRDAVYVPLRIEPDEDGFRRFLDGVRGRGWLDWRGLSVTIPHKEHALRWVGEANCDPLAVRIGAVNTITLSPDGSARGDNTDYAGAIDALCDAMGISREGLAGRGVAVLGAGGAARAIVAALAEYQADVTIHNRTLARAESLAGEFGGRAATLDSAGASDAEIVINCTAVGMHPKVETTPLAAIPPSVRVVFDTVYNPLETRLLATAKAGGLLCVSGLDMFVNQAVAQFERWTDTLAPRDVMRDVVVKRLAGRGES